MTSRMPAVYMLWSGGTGATILPITHRRTGRPPRGARRYDAGYAKPHGDANVKSYDERNDDGIDFWIGLWTGFGNSFGFNVGYGSQNGLRHSSLYR